jgi:putative endonuclease
VLARRARTEAGEVDLVVADNTTLIFVEVKRRRTMLAATEALQPRQRQRIAGAAAILLARNPEWQRPDTRFDVILATNDGINHLADAFRPE